MRGWKAFFFKGIGAFLLGIAFAAFFFSILVFLLPGVQSSLVHKANEEYAPRMVPILLEYEPELSTLTYGNTVSYCQYKPPGVSMEFGGITDEYVCSLVQNNYVSNTEELRLRLARELISINVDNIMANYGLEIANFYSKLPVLLAVFLFSLLLSFPFLYFGSRNLLELAFIICALSAFFSFAILLASGLAFLILPGQIIAQAKAAASLPLYVDLISVSEDIISEAFGELLLPPIVIFRLLSIISGLSAASFYYYLAKIRRG